MKKSFAPDAPLLAQAGAILGLDPALVLFETGYETSNKDSGRLAAAQAELRAVVFLAGQGFCGIRLVPPSVSPTADILAARAGTLYAFEVQCVTRRSSFCAPGCVKPAAALAAKVRAKIKQAGAFKKKNSLGGLGVVLVLDAAGGAPAALARAAWEGAGSPSGAHVCVLSGGRGGVWPAWRV
jgi:hypothetical protein